MIRDRLKDMKAIMNDDKAMSMESKPKKLLTKFTNQKDSASMPLMDTPEEAFSNLESKISDTISKIQALQEEFKNTQTINSISMGEQSDAPSTSREFIKLIKEADDAMKSMEKLINNSGSSPTVYKMRQNIYISLLVKLKSVSEEFNNCIIDYSERSKEHLKKQMNIIGYDSSEYDTVFSSPENYLFAGNYLKLSKQTQKEIQESTERYEELKMLENDIMELRDMFVLISVEVDKQGEKLDSIEHQVTSAKEYITSGENQLSQAKRSRNKRRRTKIICAVIGIVILSVIVIILLLNFL